MILYSHVALIIPLAGPSGDAVTEHLGISPTKIRANKGYGRLRNGSPEEIMLYAWVLDSPKDVSHEPLVRINALLDAIETFSDRLRSLDKGFRRWIDVVYHVTPQHAHGITGEFDWVTLGHQTMGRMARLELMFSYESFWFDHPDWRLTWRKRLRRLLRKEPNHSTEPSTTAHRNVRQQTDELQETTRT
jgi:hypothetical protein